MAICPVCGGRVTGERYGAVLYNGRYYHKSCLRKIRRRRPSRKTWYIWR